MKNIVFFLGLALAFSPASGFAQTTFGNWTLSHQGLWPTGAGIQVAGGDATFGFSSTVGKVSLQIDGAFRQQETGMPNYFMDAVGIGASNPQGLQVNLALQSELSLSETNVRMGVLGGTPRLILDHSGSQTFEIDNFSGRFRIFNPGVERFTISASGDVGIGTTTPDAKLTVKGLVHAQEVKVDLNGAAAPDYVFENGYALLPLKEVKSFIDKNKHLPEVPSAKEMELSGIDLGQMNLILLKKIEELTLYVIEQKEQLEKVQAELRDIKNKRQ
jgi:hypothetical protein